MRFSSFLLAGILVTTAPMVASAGSVSFLAGDKDCFGETDTSPCTTPPNLFPEVAPPPADGAALVFDNRSGSDPAVTDFFGFLGEISLSFDVDLAGQTALSASLTTRTVGLDLHFFPSTGADDNVGAVFSLNGSQIGTFFEPTVIGATDHRRRVADITFDIPLALLQDGAVNTLTIRPEDDFGVLEFEDYAVDFSELTVITEDVVAPIPLPAAGLVLIGGLAGLAALRRRT